MVKKTITILVLILGLHQLTQGQFFFYGQEPAAAKWYQMQSNHFKVIFDEAGALQAYYYLHYLEKNHTFFKTRLGIAPPYTPVVIHNRDVVANGFSVMAPLRMEIGSIPPQDMYAQPWLQQLSVHEFRHSLQIETFRNGFARHFTWLFGDVAIGAAMSRLPFWFIEGDAVVTETAFSSAGRGREGDFLMETQALLDTYPKLRYDIFLNGSYKRYIPNHYHLGYHLVGYGFMKHGEMFWEKIKHHTADNPLGWRPFARAIKKYHGTSLEIFYEEAMQDVKQHLPDTVRQKAEMLSASKKTEYHSMKNPYQTQNGVIAYEKSLDDIPGFVLLRKGVKKPLFKTGFVFDEQITANDHQVAFVEYIPDKRWSRAGKTGIYVYDLTTRHEQLVKAPQRAVYSPSLHPRKPLMVAVTVDDWGRHHLLQYSFKTQKWDSLLSCPVNETIAMPQWSADGRSIVFLVVSTAGKTIREYFPESGKVVDRFGPVFFDLSKPFRSTKYVFFVAPFREKNELYALQTATRQLYRVLDSRFGLATPSFTSDGQILYADYQANGYKIKRVADKESQWTRVELPRQDPFRVASRIARAPLDFKELPHVSYDSSRFRKGRHLFNFHSLTPFDYTKTSTFNGYGVAAHSQNLLTTMFTSAGYRYDENRRAGDVFLEMQYRGWYPVLNIKAEYGNRDAMATLNDEPVYLKWNRLHLTGGVALPLRLNGRDYNRFVQLEANTEYYSNDITNVDSLTFEHQYIHALSYRLYYQNVRRMSHQDLYPRWGQMLELQFEHDPFSWSNAGGVFSAEAVGYFPGLQRNQHFWVYAGYQKKDSESQPLAGNISFPRGTGYLAHNRILVAKSNYSFPVAYPEWHVGPLAYVKRIRANLFVDFAAVEAPQRNDDIMSVGTEIMFDMHLLRLIAPTQTGFRSTYSPEKKSMTFDFIINMDFNIY
jgi:hypothetical protein